MEAMGQLAGGIAHDFNNQMAGALGYAVLLKERVLGDSRASRYVNNIVVGIRRASDLTAQILAFARRGRYLNLPVDLHAVINETANLLEHSIDKRIKLHCRLDASWPWTLGDPTQIQNVILNIAINARDAMPQGGVLTIGTDEIILDEQFCRRHAGEPQPGRFVRVRITDTGNGIDKDTLLHIFEPFFTTKPAGKGIGMGLAAAYGTVRSHGGIITVESEPGRGSSFELHFPAHDAEPAPAEGEKVVPAKRIVGNPHVLVVDDEPIVAEMAVDMLTSLGCRVTSVDNGGSAVTYFRDAWAHIDVVLLDMVMPDMTGSEVFEQMHAVDPNVRVLISSGYSMTKEIQQVLDGGACGYLQKPYDSDELATGLRKGLDAPRPCGESHRVRPPVSKSARRNRTGR
jgi:CheY-like chemotaxis protein